MSANLGSRIVLASHNAGKLTEFQGLLAPLGVEVVSAGALGLPEPEETGDTFTANALLKAHAAAQAAGIPALSDDSGMSVAALDGAPGIYSARWAGANKDFAAAMQRVSSELEARNVAPNGADAQFVCVIALAMPDGTAHTFEGILPGKLVFPPRGEKGFGYDPCFVPQGESRSFGEMTLEEKHTMSHRARAVTAFLQWVKAQ
jgi:XTP/dITP diphosphohydrolase